MKSRRGAETTRPAVTAGGGGGKGPLHFESRVPEHKSPGREPKGAKVAGLLTRQSPAAQRLFPPAPPQGPPHSSPSPSARPPHPGLLGPGRGWGRQGRALRWAGPWAGRAAAAAAAGEKLSRPEREPPRIRAAAARVAGTGTTGSAAGPANWLPGVAPGHGTAGGGCGPALRPGLAAGGLSNRTQDALRGRGRRAGGAAVRGPEPGVGRASGQR